MEKTESKYDSTFENVVGMKEAKKVLSRDLINPLIHKEEYVNIVGTEPSGILFYGPPGCGKTNLIEAVSGEVSKQSGVDLNVVRAYSSDLLGVRGYELQQIAEFFNELQENTPSLGIMYEFTSLGPRRTENDKLVGSIAEGFDKIKNKQVTVLAEVNSPLFLDSSLLRPGRLSTKIFVEAPKYEERIAMFELALNDKPTEDININELAHLTAGYSYADIKSICRSAGMDAVKKSIDGKSTPLITQAELLQATDTTSSLECWANETITAMMDNRYSKNPKLKNGISLDYLPLLETAVKIRNTLEGRIVDD